MPEDVAKCAKAKDDDPETRSSTPEFVDAADILKLVGTESEGVLYSTNRMQARFAEDFLGDAYNKRAGELVDAMKDGRPFGTNLAGGQSYGRIVASMKHIEGSWERVAQAPPDTTGSLTAEKLYSAYDTALTQYWKLLTKIKLGLNLEGVVGVIGPVFWILLQHHLTVAKTAGDKIIAETKTLDAQKAAAVVAWTDKTQAKIAAAALTAYGYESMTNLKLG